jgi:hypothetical protein
MKTKLIIAVLALLMTSGAAPVHAGGKPIPEGDSWARAIGDIRTLEDDHVGCSTQDDMALVNAILRNTLGISMDLPPGCTIFSRGQHVVVVNLEYVTEICGLICAQIHLLGDQRRYWVDAPIELVLERPRQSERVSKSAGCTNQKLDDHVPLCGDDR